MGNEEDLRVWPTVRWDETDNFQLDCCCCCCLLTSCRCSHTAADTRDTHSHRTHSISFLKRWRRRIEDEAEERKGWTRAFVETQNLFLLFFLSFFTLRLLAAIVDSFPTRKTCPNGPWKPLEEEEEACSKHPSTRVDIYRVIFSFLPTIKMFIISFNSLKLIFFCWFTTPQVYSSLIKIVMNAQSLAFFQIVGF